ncbi:MAG: hypothetical protein KC800_33930 [Candidatus Eremiobacteraeota bacterium]|nr:hypothetical protein [Candidatus Eremiobacteraeota bacterium]
MLINSKSALRKSGPPVRNSLEKYEVSRPLDLVAANDNPSDKSLKATLAAMASLVAVMAPQAAHAQSVAAADASAVELLSESDSFADRVEDRVDSIGDKVDGLKNRLDPNGYLEEWSTKVGDYDLSVNPIDLDLKPRWKDGPALRFRGDIMETRLSKTRELESGWSMTQGANAKITGELSTYNDAELDLQGGLFREYRGPVGENFQARLRNEVGLRHRFVGEDEGLRVGVSFRQELEGGQYEVFGHDFSLYAEGRQSAYQNLDNGQTELSYKFMAGPKKDFDFKLLGQDVNLSVTVGPEIKGSNHGESFDWGVGSKVRLRLQR